MSLPVYHRCGGCGKTRQFVNSEKFRVNANGSLVDIWLIYRCIKCKHSWNLTVYSRVRPSRLDPELYQRFLDNDSDLAQRLGNDSSFLKQNGARMKP